MFFKSENTTPQYLFYKITRENGICKILNVWV